MKKILYKFKPDYIHIATEGGLGMYANKHLAKNNIPFTTGYHTKFPEIFNKYIKLPLFIGYKILRNFHKKSHKIFVPSKHIIDMLLQRDFPKDKIVLWRHGVDTKKFNPKNRKTDLYINNTKIERPIWLNVSRVSVEKNIETFLKMDLGGGTKVVIGDGPKKHEYEKKYPNILFLGYKHGNELVELYASADVFVFSV